MFVWHHHSLPITQYFSHYLWAPYLSLDAAFSFSFFSSIPKLTEPREKKKKLKVVKSCDWVLFVGPLYVFNYNIVIKLWVMETENSQNVFSVSITLTQKSDNWVMETELSCAKRILSYGSHHFWVMSYGN